MTLNVTNAARLAAVWGFNVELDSKASDFGGKGGSVVHYKSSRNSNLLLDTPAIPKRGDNVIYSSSPCQSVGGGGALVNDGVIIE